MKQSWEPRNKGTYLQSTNHEYSVEKDSLLNKNLFFFLFFFFQFKVFPSQVAHWYLLADVGDIRDPSSISGLGRSLGGGNATHSNILS